MADCVFCRIAARELPTALLHETPSTIAFNDINPSAPVHILIVPKKHIPSYLEIAPEDKDILVEMIGVAQCLIRECSLTDAYRVIFNGGRFQHVPHLHWHLIGPAREK